MAEERSALFVRIPAAQARRLDARARDLGRSKQDFVSGLLATSLGPPPAEDPDGARVADGLDGVMTLRQLADMLQLGEGPVMERVATGELPGRRFGDEWRFSRSAVMRWLAGTDAERSRPGFAGGRQLSATADGRHPSPGNRAGRPGRPVPEPGPGD